MKKEKPKRLKPCEKWPRVFISGPMSGIYKLNEPAFEKAAEKLRSRGHFVINPFDIARLFGGVIEVEMAREKSKAAGHDGEIDKRSFNIYSSVLRADIAALKSCDAIYMLNGWEESVGAQSELMVALENKIRVLKESR